MGELRRNGVTGTWVVVAPSRGDRPLEVKESAEPARPPWDAGCPFCPGNERELAKLLWELPDGDGGWRTRSVSNPYPAFEPPTAGTRGDPDREVAAAGWQEVLVETPRHDLDPSRQSPGGLRALVESCHRRYVHLAGLPGVEQVFLFRNHGAAAGVSLAHPHSQLVATTFTPPLLSERRERLVAHHRASGACLLCGIARASLDGRDAGNRRVGENPSFRALVPWAAECPFELWIIPLGHRADFAAIEETERADLTDILGRVLRAYREGAGDPPYNYMVESWGRRFAGDPCLHWFLRILPRHVRRAGFEIGSGIAINPSRPERDAEILRSAIEARRSVEDDTGEDESEGDDGGEDDGGGTEA